MRRLLLWLAWLGGLLILVLGVLRDLPVNRDLAAFLPQEAEQRGALMADVREGRAGRVILVVLSGAGSTQLAEASRELRGALESEPSIDRVRNGASGRGEAAVEQLFQWRYRLSPEVSPERFTVPALRKALEERLKELQATFSPVPRSWIRQDPSGEAQAVLARWHREGGAQRRHGVWFSGDGEHALLVVESAAPLADLGGQRTAMAAVEAAAAGLQAVEARLFGPGVLAVRTADRIRAETTTFSILASLVVAVVLLAAYRTAWPLVVAVVPVLSALVAGVVAVALLFGSIHGITLAFGITLVGVTLDYPLHLFSHAREGKVLPVVRRLWPTLLLSALSTAIGYGVLVTTDLTGLVQLGLFTFTGVLVAAAATRWLVPRLLPSRVGLEPRSLPELPTLLPGWGPPALAVLAAVVLVPFGDALWEEDPSALSPVSQESVAQTRAWQAELGVPESSSALFVTGGSVEAVLRRAEALRPDLQALREEGHLRGFDLLTERLPSARTQRRRLEALPGAEEARRALDRATHGLPFRTTAFAPFLNELDAHRSADPVVPGDLRGSALEVRVAPLLERDEAGRHRLLVPLEGLRDREAVAEWAAGYGGVQFIDLRTESSRAMIHYREQAVERLVIGIGAIALVLMTGLGSPLGALRRLVPVLSALVVTATVLVLSGEALSLFHLMGLALAGGIVMDYALFRQREGSAGACGSTRHALLVCSISTIGVFGILAASAMPVLRALGLTVAVGVATGLLFTLLTAPEARPAGENGFGADEG